MRMFILYILFSLFAYGIISCEDRQDDLITEDTDPAEIVEALDNIDISYGDNVLQTYDIYLPKGRTSTATKTVILIHGGGWTSGDKADMMGLITLIQTTHPDYAIVNMNYILAQPPAVPAFPNQFIDVQSVIDQLSNRSEDLGISQDFALVGVSAGAHIAMMYDYTYDTDNQVKFVANIVGPADFTDPFYASNPNTDLFTTAYVDASAYPTDANLTELLSPAVIVTQNASPTLLFYGNEDPLVPLSNGQRLDVGLSNAGVPHIFTVYDGGHGNWSTESYLDVQAKIGTYLDQYLPID